MIVLANNYCFDNELLADAITLPSGAFIEVDDLTFQLNGMGRKVAQTMRVTIGGRAVSMAYIDGETYDLVLARDRPEVLGSYVDLRRRHADKHRRLVGAFGGPGHFTPLEMVTALVAMTTGGFKNAGDAAAWARRHVRRCAWLLRNRLEATASAPVIWASLGL